MRPNRSVPSATVLPLIAYPDIGEAIEWLGRAFGFTLRLRIGNHRAQMNVGGGAVILTQAGEGEPPKSATMIRVANADAHCAQARLAGARIQQVPATHPYGERQYTVLDHAGHHWCFTESVADVNPIDWGGTPGDLQ